MSDNITSNDYQITPVVEKNDFKPVFQYLLMQEQKNDIALTSAINIDDMVVNVSSGHGFTGAAGEFMVCRNGNGFFQLRVTSVSVDAITVESPIDDAYPIEGTTIIRGNANMDIDGSLQNVDFKYSFNNDTEANLPIEISGIIFSFQSGNNVPDDGNFGGISELANGLLLRKVNGSNSGLGNYTSNQEFRDVGGLIEYSTKGPGGTNGTNVFINIKERFGTIVRLDPTTQDEIFARVRDNLTTLDKFTMAIIGSFRID